MAGEGGSPLGSSLAAHGVVPAALLAPAQMPKILVRWVCVNSRLS
jgi:hypothetical protein